MRCINDISDCVFLPERVKDVAEPRLLLNGDWEFSSDLNTAEWQNVVVPSELVMQGIDILQDTEYYYRKVFKIPQDYEGKNIFLQFDGVYNKARLFINGSLVMEHLGGFTTWYCNITHLVHGGDNVTLVLGITDVKNCPSLASFYAHHNICGILRDVYLLCVPKSYIKNIKVAVDFNDDFSAAFLKLNPSICTDGYKMTNVNYEVFTPDTNECLVSDRIIVDETSELEINVEIKNPVKWDAEHPNLYEIHFDLISEGKVVEQVKLKAGLREITYGGAKGTDKRKVYINGNEIKLRGICRHDVSYEYGRYVKDEELRKEIRAYKEHNVNFIRTSHYPPSKKLLELCDEIGIYIEEETSTCWYGFEHHKYTKELADWAYAQFVEMIDRDFNHPCIIIWSLANESRWNVEGGEANRKKYEYIKKADKSRPVIFSWPDEETQTIMDIYSYHYCDINAQEITKPNVPALHDEFAHVSCYNIDEIKNDINVRNFWGDSLRRFWDRFFDTDGVLGGAIWAGVDDVFYISKNITQIHQKHSHSQAAGYGEWGCIFDIYKRLKPEAYLTKKAYSPVKIEETAEELIYIYNRFDHTNLNEIKAIWHVNGKQGEFVLQSLEPHGKTLFVLPDEIKYENNINIKFVHINDGIIFDEYILRKTRQNNAANICLNNKSIAVEEYDDIISIDANDFSVKVDRLRGKIIKVLSEDKVLITGGPFLKIEGLEIGQWVQKDIEVSVYKDKVTMNSSGTYGELSIRFIISISGNGSIQTDYELLSLDEKMESVSKMGIWYEVPDSIDSISFDRNGCYSFYPENHIGRNAGKAYRKRPGYNQLDEMYGKRPKWDFKDDMFNFFMNENIDDKNLFTNDFLCTRENIYEYTLNFAVHDKKIKVVSKGDCAVKLNSTELLIYNEWSYPQLGWGNYTKSPVEIKLSKMYSTEILIY